MIEDQKEKISEKYYDFLRESENESDELEINYDDLLDLTKKKMWIREDEEGGENDAIVFYCGDCEKEVSVERLPAQRRQKVKFKCKECEGTHVFFGTKRGITDYFQRERN